MRLIEGARELQHMYWRTRNTCQVNDVLACPRSLVSHEVARLDLHLDGESRIPSLRFEFDVLAPCEVGELLRSCNFGVVSRARRSACIPSVSISSTNSTPR